jgi:GNAT superfamily N-acetyltransferase
MTTPHADNDEVRGYEIRECRPDEWPRLAENVHAMWRDIGAGPGQITPDWRDEVLRFLRRASEDHGFRGCVAVREGRIVGSAGGQRQAGLSPDILEPSYRRRGYVWGVYVHPDHRGRGLGAALTRAVVERLRASGCTQVHLHAAPLARPVYERLGFAPSNEMRLVFPAAQPAPDCA